TVNIASGTYNENISFGEINGASATNTITLQSAALSADSVVWQNNSNNYSKNYAVNLDGTDHMRFKHITFSGTVASYSRQMVVTGVVDSLVVDSCHFETNATSVGSNSNYTSFYGYNAYLSGLQITNSTFENTHHYAIYIDANAVTPRPSNIEISNNRFINMYMGIFVDYHDKVSIRNNTVSNSTSMGTHGIYLNEVDSATVIENNRIYDPENTLGYGIYLSGCNASEENPGRIINNIIQSNTYGIYMWNDVSYYNLYHNTIYTHSSNPLHIYYSASHLSIKNNIMMSDGASSYIYLGNNSYYVSSAYLDMDYNNIFFSNSSYSPFRVSSANYTLSTWQSTFGHDSNSVITDPYFTDSTLVPFSPWMDNMGTPISGITLDINGATRSETTPDVGAAEFSGFSGSPLSGSYTIGTGGNYTSMDTLQRDLTLLGINGPVVLNFLEGTYTEPLALSEVPGSSALNTITFQSADQNASSVNWQRASISTDNYTNSYILKLNGTDHVKIKHMTFQVTGGYHISKLRLSGQTDSISVDSVTFIDTYSSNGRSGYGIFSTSGSPVIGVSVKNCSFTNTPGARNVYYGTEITFLSDQINTSIESGLEISNNTLLNSYRGINIYKYNGITVRGNTVRGDGQNDYGFRFGYLSGNGIIENNSIYDAGLTYGMYFDYNQGTNDTARISVVNNRILTEDYGIYSIYSYYTDFYYNTIHTRDDYPLYTYYNQNMNLKNNIFSVDENNTSRPAAHFSGYYTLTSDYNNFYTNYTYPVYWNGNRTLQSFQSSGYDSNSVEINPLFNTDSTLIPTSFRLDDKGSPISTITQDALGLARSATTPDMGAVEFTVEPLVISGAYTVGAGGDYSSLSAALRDAYNYGLSGAVTYNMLPGVYTDQVNFGNVFGASATNTITVQSSTGNASDVVWQPPNSNYYAFKLNGSSYVTIKNMTFNTSANSSGSKALDISNSSSHLRVEGNIFEGYNYTSTSINHALIHCYTNYGQDIVITNNSFEEGGHGIYLSHAGNSGVKITNNSFTGMRDGINVLHTDSLQVNGNTISTSHSGYGIYMYSSSYVTITGNKILNTFGLGNISTGLYLGSSNGNANNRMLIANNLIEGYTNALYLNYSNYYDLYHNTLKSNSTSWYNSYATLRLHYSSYGQVKNNIIQRDSVNTSSSNYYTIYAFYSTANMTYDYNILYNAGNGSIQNQGVSLGTNNQLNVDPGLYDGGDGFHLAAANELGTPLTEVTVDVDGEP
ncbi:MAG: right-handed parallel beta-helix repeat-containing protein, partial [Candidatus Neomarinimicrobiota bacterium]|nr:right-handed parallel beta-helix repeat-containing protein [Candidatus Neomarinimicrobiota bacterium]